MSTKDQQFCSRLSIRKIDLDTDVDDYYVWASDDEVTQFCSFDSYKSREQVIEFIKSVINHPYFKVICIDNKVIGAIKVTLHEGNDKYRPCRGELGYVLAKEYWGRGIATWALKMVVSTVFEEQSELERIQGLVDVENIGSQKVLEKAGFVKEGVMRKYFTSKGKIRDIVMFSILREDKR